MQKNTLHIAIFRLFFEVMNSPEHQYQTNLEIDRVSNDVDVVTRILDFIDSGGFKPGDRLPAERHLMSKLGVPRGALRRAFDTLEREGTIWRHVGKGTFMSRDRPGMPGALGDWTADIARHLTPLRMVRARLCIEPAIAREAAINASSEALIRMRHALERASAASHWQDYETQDDLFHRAIAEATDNPLLIGLFDQLNTVRRAVAFDAVKRTTARPSANHSSFAEHEAIARAIELRDRKAAQDTMQAHLQSVSRRLFEEG